MMEDTKNLPELPKGWVWTRLGEVAELIKGVSYRKEEVSKNYKSQYIPILRANNINYKLTFDNLVYVPKNRVKNIQFIKKGDVIIAMSSGSKDLVGKAAQALRDMNASFGVFCGLVRPTKHINSIYFGFFFQSQFYRKKISEFSSGVNINNLRRSHIEKMVFPLPPLAEQHRIVAKIEELFTKLDVGLEALKKTKTLIKRYRQSVLKYAFEGKLTQTWRETHKNELEPASKLLERIKKEHKKKLGKKYKELPPVDTEDLPELPEGWVWTRLGEVAEINPKITDNIPGDLEVTFLPMKAVEELTGKFDLSQTRKYDEVKKGYTPFRDGDIIFAKITPCMENGKIAILQGLKNQIGFGSTEFHVIRLANILPQKHIFYFLIQDIFRKEAKRNMTGTAGQLRVPARFLENVFIPLPPLAEQHKIVEEIEKRFSIVDNVEQLVNQILKQGERLRQSILKKAFEGKLVPQDPSDEPASKLLERIQQQKEALKKTKKIKKNK